MKKTLQKTAREYADSVINSFGRSGVPNGISDIKEMLALAFKNGAEWQSKQSPWISVKEKVGCDFGTILAQIDDVKWVNDYELSKVVIELKKRLAEAEEKLKEKMENNK